MRSPVRTRPASAEVEATTSASNLLEVRGLSMSIATRRGTVRAVDDVSFDIGRAESLCVVGESGCGKSMMTRSLMRLLPRGAKVTSGTAMFDGVDLIGLPDRQLQDIRGCRIGMLFQDPMTSLSPLMPIGQQIIETIRRHTDASRAEAKKRAAELLDEVHIPNARQRMGDYPHQYSGGMRQRVMMAIALSCDPDLLIADEPTTALDVTVQASILELLAQLRESRGLSLLMITHDMRVVERVADTVVVMYAGQVVEKGKRETVLDSPEHPYTEALLGALPDIDDPDARTTRLTAITGTPPDLTAELTGCRFAPRCPHAGLDDCARTEVSLAEVAPDHTARTLHPASSRAGGGR